MAGTILGMSNDRVSEALERVRSATLGTDYEQKLWLVGGYVRDKLLGLPNAGDDIDIVLEQDASQLTEFLSIIGLSDHKPVVYPRFGTAMTTISGVNFELVTARRESYAAGSRKPTTVQPATILEDARRRDFTINTLLENLHTGETLDPLGVGLTDLRLGIIKTPLPAADTFDDDPLRMLRAIRFAARFAFNVDDETWAAVLQKADILVPTVSGERIRDEFNKILMAPQPETGLKLLLQSHLLGVFAPEVTGMVGVTQNEFHNLPVWEHSLLALTNLVSSGPESPLLLRLAVLLHDCGKPSTRSIAADGRVHFYEHQDVGSSLARTLLLRLKFSHADVDIVSALIALHMRIGEYRPEVWSDAAVRRFIRAAGPLLDWLFAIHRADVSALDPKHQNISRAVQLRERIMRLQSEADSRTMESPLNGSEIMEIVGIPPGPEVGVLKNALTEAVIDGKLGPEDKTAATELARELHLQSA
jgi:poly(A) polymerase